MLYISRLASGKSPACMPLISHDVAGHEVHVTKLAPVF
jgi:hypothetical protein